jgi:signal transduction histidine kinase
MATVDAAFETTGAKRRRVLGVLTMAGVLLLQLTTEYLATRDRGRFLLKTAALVTGVPLLLVWASAVFRWSSRRRTGVLAPLFVGALVSAVAFAGLLWLARLASFSIPALQPHYGPWGGTDVLRVGFALGLTTFAIWSLAFVFPFALEDARVRALEAENLRAQVELAHLRSGLEPHFLLNTLNTISGLVTEDPRQARRLLGNVGDLLRDLVAPAGEMQTLDEQLAWLRRYAEILETRHAGQLSFGWDVGRGTTQALLPRMLLQPLVENAVKHGALMRAGGGAVTIRAEVADGARLVCTVEDNGPGIPDGPARPGAFGILSVRRRLALRYGRAATLRAESSAAGARFIIELPIQDGGPS